jgi:hypothetical protein
MDPAAGLTLEAIFKGEVLLASILTLGLLALSIIKKDELKSDETREKLAENIKMFWIITVILIIPLILFVSWEILDLFTLGAPIELISQTKIFISKMRVLTFSILDLGLLMLYYLYVKVKGN